LPLVPVASMIVVTVALRPIKIINKRFRLCIIGFMTLLSSDKNNQLLSGSQPAPHGGESLASLLIIIIIIINSYTLVTSVRPTHGGNLCYVCRVDKTLWDRKPLTIYTAATCS